MGFGFALLALLLSIELLAVLAIFLQSYLIGWLVYTAAAKPEVRLRESNPFEQQL